MDNVLILMRVHQSKFLPKQLSKEKEAQPKPKSNCGA
jgi:hypothetical protein